ncbi:MAG TPA: cupin domain-containing protein, partial [Steroidobacteraceae bacterium]|nr:cupin domain-containing protein [Steroidobacteraceae bacterium]
GLLGPDPEATLLAAFQLAPKLTFHSANPSGPAPSLQGVTDTADFRRRIEQFHERHYSVRFPELRPLSPALEGIAGALEVLLHQPVTASAFWSRGGMRAPVHFDDHDLLVVQLQGFKRWYVSSKPSELPNTWKGIPRGPPELGPHETVDVRPGDLLYLPRGTYHSVDSDSGSLHVSIGFTPLTLREAVIAAIDHLSDLDPGLRRTLGGRLAFQLAGPGLEQLVPQVVEAVAGLLAACRAPGFIASALHWRSARAVAALAALPAPEQLPAIGLDTELVHAARAFCQMMANPQTIDVAYPGGHLYINRGAEQGIVFMVNTPRFRVRDIAGDIGDDVRLSLATRFLQVGFLELAPASARASGGAAAA